MDLNEKLAQRRKEREQIANADRRELASVKKSQRSIKYYHIILFVGFLMLGVAFSFKFFVNKKIENDIKAAFDHYGVFLRSEYASVRLVDENNACIVFCEKGDCRIANFMKLYDGVWVVKNIDGTRKSC